MWLMKFMNLRKKLKNKLCKKSNDLNVDLDTNSEKSFTESTEAPQPIPKVETAETNIEIKNATPKKSYENQEKSLNETMDISSKMMEKEIIRHKKAMIERKQKQIIINKKAVIFYKAALKATDNNYEIAKRVLGLKKSRLIENCNGSIIDILALDKAIESLDEIIIQQHGEIIFTSNTK